MNRIRALLWNWLRPAGAAVGVALLAGCALLNPGGVLNQPTKPQPPQPGNGDLCQSATTAAECGVCADQLAKETAVLSPAEVQRALDLCKARVVHAARAQCLKARADVLTAFNGFIDDTAAVYIERSCEPWMWGL